MKQLKVRFKTEAGAQELVKVKKIFAAQRTTSVLSVELEKTTWVIVLRGVLVCGALPAILKGLSFLGNTEQALISEGGSKSFELRIPAVV